MVISNAEKRGDQESCLAKDATFQLLVSHLRSSRHFQMAKPLIHGITFGIGRARFKPPFLFPKLGFVVWGLYKFFANIFISSLLPSLFKHRFPPISPGSDPILPSGSPQNLSIRLMGFGGSM